MPVTKTKSNLSKSLAIVGEIISKVEKTLEIIFYIVWIIIGLVVLVVIVQSFRQGAFAPLFAGPQQPQQQVQAPTETDLPGIGKINIACVQEALSDEGIQKIVQGKGTASLTDEEKARLEPCIIEKEATPSPSPSS